jgi:hypothetical protein
LDWFFGLTGFFGFFYRIFWNIIMMTQRLALLYRDHNFFDNGQPFFDFWSICIDERVK